MYPILWYFIEKKGGENIFFFPLIIGIIVAIVLTIGVRMLKNKGFSKNTFYAFTLAQLLIGVLFIVYGYVEVRGWEGLAFMQLGTPIILVSFISFIVYISNSNKVIRE
ncbi:YesK family protein [Rummeliibacillus sp. POC4]|uniref:YesK family protein n=1 Tax=Rummeliibacillus sp. POC4 TaxID=2305899 RepID=UPI000E672F8A|nr:hypothetical protein D1606_15480 [Rummeliibacillus sp. POC4]